MTKPDYAKWMLDDPRVNFAISGNHHAAKGIEHLGIQVESDDELAEVYGRLKAADRPCSKKAPPPAATPKARRSGSAIPTAWFGKPSYTKGEATVYGDSPALGAVSANASNDTCCAPAITADPASNASCG